MGWKTKKVQKSKPVSRYNSNTGKYETSYETYYADESYFEADTSSSYSSSDSSSGGSYE